MQAVMDDASSGRAESPMILQPLWDHLKTHKEVLLSPYLPTLYAFVTHVLLCSPFLLLDALGCLCARVGSCRMSGRPGPGLLQKWLASFRRVILAYVLAVLPVTAALQCLRSPAFPEVAPSGLQLFAEVSACLLLFDMLFFIWHYIMHRVPWLYRNVHRAHHQNRSPFAMAAQDASPAELLSLLLLALLSARLLGCHPLSELLFHLLNSWLAVEDHCGYDLPWGLHQLLPGMGGAPHHQAHHIAQKGNYAPYFTHWDRLFGTRIL